jgi:glucokinase
MKSMTSALAPLGIIVQELAAIGIGAPGVSDPVRGVVFTSPNLPGWHNVPLRDIVARESGVPSYLINDANAAALGELYFGAARGMRQVVYVTVSTGIGGGIIIDGELYCGSVGTAGEIGHMTIDANGPHCQCGNSGCWEVLASGTALADRARQQIKGGTKTSILDLAGGDLEKVTAPVIQAAAEQGDPLAGELIARTGYYLGVGLANLINIFNPELIVIGGGLSNIGDALLGPAIRVAGERSFKEAYQSVRFTLPELGADAGVLGAAAFARRSVAREEK